MKAVRKKVVKLPIVSWRPKAPSKEQRFRRALETHHRAKRTGPKCSVTGCNKTSVELTDHCAMHRSLLNLHVPINMDQNTYG